MSTMVISGEPDEPRAETRVEGDRLQLSDAIMRAQVPELEDGSGFSCDELLAFFRAAGYLQPAFETMLAPMMSKVHQTLAAAYREPSAVDSANTEPAP